MKSIDYLKTLSFLLLLSSSFFLFGCKNSSTQGFSGEASTLSNLTNRKESINIAEISGNWRGSYTDKDYGFRLAIKLTVNKDGTYKRVFFSEGDPIDSASGKAETYVEKNEEKDNYGENKATTYLHGIKFYLGAEWGFKTEIYQINANLELAPIRSFVDGGADIVLTKEAN